MAVGGGLGVYRGRLRRENSLAVLHDAPDWSVEAIGCGYEKVPMPAHASAKKFFGQRATGSVERSGPNKDRP